MFNRVSFLDKFFFTKHLQIMLKSGIPMAEAIDSLEDQARNAAFKKILGTLSSDVRQGKSLTEALGRHSQVFDPLYLSLVKMGERSGNLEKNLDHLGRQLEKEHQFRKKIQSALLYPVLILTATVFLGGGISFFVLPKLVDFFETLDVELPLTTKILLFFAQIMKSYGIFLLFGFFVILLSCYLVIKSRPVRPYWHWFLLKLPVIGSFIKSSQLALLSRNLGIMLKSGIPIAESLKVLGGGISNQVFKKDVHQLVEAVVQGKSIEETLKKEGFEEFPPLFTKMVGVGERTGNLEENLLYLGDFFEQEVDSLAKNFTNILEPVLLLGIGLVVGFVALAIISPIYQLTGSIRR